jgi:hypothetical protein
LMRCGRRRVNATLSIEAANVRKLINRPVG